MIPSAARRATERSASVLRGSRVRIVSGDRSGATGVVAWIGRDGGCGCLSVIVKTDIFEWYGKVSEVEII